MWNNPNDPMPIKTTNMAGLQKWEETKDYIIYLDKDAVMTTVAEYVTGSYDKFMELKSNVDSSKELLKLNGIEWTAEDDSKLFIDINDSMLEAIENTPTQLDEDEQVVQTFTSKAVPTTYECCFRVDKKSREIYIGEGYENLIKTMQSSQSHIESMVNDGGYITATFRESITVDRHLEITTSNTGLLLTNTQYSFNVGIANYTVFNKVNLFDHMFTRKDIPITESNLSFIEFTSKIFTGSIIYRLYIKRSLESSTQKLQLQITKTSTPKPFVKSVMPSGKLAFVTGATETTHTFLNKGDGVVTFGSGYFSLKGEKIQQLLVYKSLLTEQEKQAELAKDIKLATNNTQMHTQI